MFLVDKIDLFKTQSSLQFGTNVFITFIFVLFFGYFFKNIFTIQSVTPQNILINTILFIIWYCFSFLFAN